MTGFRNGKNILKGNLAMDKELQVYFNRFQRKNNRPPIYSSDSNDSEFDMFILRNPEDCDKLEDIWKKLNQNGYFFCPLKYKDKIKEFRKKNRISTTIEVLDDFWAFRKEDYSVRNSENSILTKMGQLEDNSVEVPDYRLSKITKQEIIDNCPENSIFLSISHDDLETVEMIERSMHFSTVFGLFSDQDKAHQAVLYYNSPVNFGKLTIDNLDKMCDTIRKFDEPIVIYYPDHQSISLDEIIERFKDNELTLIVNDDSNLDVSGFNRNELKSGLIAYTRVTKSIFNSPDIYYLRDIENG